MRKTIALLIGAAAALLLAACGAKHDQIQPIAGNAQNVTMMLDWSPTEFSRLRLQYASDKSRLGVTDNQWLLQYIYSLGAHGAHKF